MSNDTKTPNTKPNDDELDLEQEADQEQPSTKDEPSTEPDDESEDDEKVGYKNPPRFARWRKGCKSPNPKGRPPKSNVIEFERMSAEAIRKCILEEANQTVEISENGVVLKIPHIKGVMKRLGNKAIKGDSASIKEYIRITQAAAKGEDTMLLDLFSTVADLEKRKVECLNKPGSYEHYTVLYNDFMFRKQMRRIESSASWIYGDHEPKDDEDWRMFMKHYDELKRNPEYIAPWPLKYPSDEREERAEKDFLAGLK